MTLRHWMWYMERAEGGMMVMKEVVVFVVWERVDEEKQVGSAQSSIPLKSTTTRPHHDKLSQPVPPMSLANSRRTS
jgi:hypothetical protein